MVPINGSTFGELQRDASQWSNGLKQSVAVCNSLNLVNRHQVMGDQADYTAFKACEALFVVKHFVV